MLQYWKKAAKKLFSFQRFETFQVKCTPPFKNGSIHDCSTKFSKKFAFYAAHVALMCREINFHVVFPRLLPRLLLAAARSSFRNGLRSADLRMSRLRILRDARVTIIRGFYRYDIITWKVASQRVIYVWTILSVTTCVSTSVVWLIMTTLLVYIEKTVSLQIFKSLERINLLI